MGSPQDVDRSCLMAWCPFPVSTRSSECVRPLNTVQVQTQGPVAKPSSGPLFLLQTVQYVALMRRCIVDGDVRLSSRHNLLMLLTVM